MAVKFGWFDIPIGGDPLKYKYSANQMRDIWKSLLTNGIVPEIRQSTTGVIVPTTQLGASLSANVAQGLKVTINNGLAFIDGAYFFVYTPEEIPLQAGWVNDIVLRLDVTGSDIVYGIFNKQRSAGTIEAGLTRQGGVYELGLHSVNIPSGATQVTASMITDYRLNMSNGADGLPCCGICGSLLMPDIDAWYRAATAEQKEWFDKSQAEFATWSSQQKADFTAWFSTLKDVLDLNTATHLYNLITSHTSDKASHVTTLTHTKKGTVHNLVGTIPTAGIITINFEPTANWEDGDTFNINSVPHASYNTLGEPVSGFKTGIPVPAQINITAKIIAIGGGGGMSKEQKQLTLVTGRKSYSIGDKYIPQDVPTIAAFSYRTVIQGNKVYDSEGPTRVIERNLDTDEYKEYNFSNISGFSTYTLDIYNNELYQIGRTSTNFTVYKLNLPTQTRALYFTSSNNFLAVNYPHVVSVSNDKRLIADLLTSTGGRVGYGMFNYSTKTVKDMLLLVTGPAYLEGTGVEQRLDNGDILLGLVSNNNTLEIGRYFMATGQMSKTGSIQLPSTPCYVHSHQIGNTLMWLSYASLNNSNSGNLDLENKTITYTGFPQPPATVRFFNSFIYQNQLTFYDSNKKYTLNLLQNPPYLNSPALEILKGQWYSTPYDKIIIDAIPQWGQEQITIDGTKRLATKNLVVPIGSYDLFSSIVINISPIPPM